MPIDWDRFDREIDEAIDQSADRTDEKLAAKISSITRFRDDEIERLFPEPADTKKLYELMKIVNSSARKNTKINKIVSNAEDFGKVIFTLLKTFC